VATFQLYWFRKISGVPLCIFSGTRGHLSRITNLLKANWIAPSYERDPKTLAGFEPTAVKVEWFKVNNLIFSIWPQPPPSYNPLDINAYIISIFKHFFTLLTHKI
jgi:hypothetical protein